jgi:hypothetical protein
VAKNRSVFVGALPAALLGMVLLLGAGCGSDGGTAKPDGGGGSSGKGGSGSGSAGISGTGVGGGSAGISGTGVGGSTAGSGGNGIAGHGGVGGGTAGAAGTGVGGGTGGNAGHGGSAGGAAGNGGSSAGAGGHAGSGGSAGHGGAAGVSDAGTDASKDAESRDAETDGHKDAEADASGPVCINACVLGGNRCADGGSETCVLGSNGCTQWSSATICAGATTCAAGSGRCVCPSAPAGCTAAGTFCDGSGNLVTCHQDAQGCFSTSAPAACPTDTSCKGTLPSAACTCDNACGAAGTFCADGKTVATCALDNNTPACLTITSTTGCGGSSACVAGACVCPAIGTTAGTGCATVNATSCSGTDILTCTTEAASGCKLWQASTHCGDSGLTCGTKGSTTPACQCPENVGTDVYVDPAAGSDVAGGVFPTGLQTPASCRYASLTKGLAVVGSPGRVIAISAILPVSFGGESFPLNIPASVSLLTADATFNPADYAIAFGGGTTAVTLANGSALRGFSVVASGNAQALVSCSTGSVVLDTLLLNGNGSVTDGFDVTGTCSAATNGVGIENLAGVALNVTSSAISTVNGGSLLRSAIGLLLTTGTVNATGLTVESNSVDGILLPNSGLGSATLSLASQTVVDANNVGVDVEKGSLSALDSVVSGNLGGAGLLLNSTGSHQLTTVTVSGNGAAGIQLTAGTLTASSLTANSNASHGLSISAGTATLTASTLNQNGGRGLSMSGGTVTVSGGTIDANTGAGLLASAGTLTVQDGAELAGNGASGLQLTGATATVAGASLHNNVANGLLVNNTTTGATVNFGSPSTVTTVGTNGNDGILVDASTGTASGATSLTIDTVGISGNTVYGVYLQGDTGSIVATIKNSTVTTSGDVGILVEQGGANQTSSTIQFNDVSGNNTDAATTHIVGGILFNTSSTLSSFIGNKVHSNGGDELGFNAAPTAGLRWVINPPSAACDNTANSLYCYGTGHVGLNDMQTLVTVDAQHVHWTNNPPTLATDYSGALSTVTATNPCTAVPTCP